MRISDWSSDVCSSDLDEGFDEAGPTGLADRHRPGIEEQGFNVEDHEKHRDQIDLRRKPQPCTAFADPARLERLVFCARPITTTQHLLHTAHQRNDPDRNSARLNPTHKSASRITSADHT